MTTKEEDSPVPILCGACGQTLPDVLRRGGFYIKTERGIGLTIASDGKSSIIGKDSSGVIITDLQEGVGELHRCSR